MTKTTHSEVSPSASLKNAVSYRKFAAEQLTALMIGENYPLRMECERAMAALGHRVVSVPFDEAHQDIVRQLLVAIVSHKPDFLLSINHFAFDEGGVLGNLLAELQMPVAVWYVDCPLFFVKDRVFPAADVSTLFLWEQTLIAPCREKYDLEHVHYLPLATDLEMFEPDRVKRSGATVFVGDSMEHAREKWHAKLSSSSWNRALSFAAELDAQRREKFVELLTSEALEKVPTDEKWDTVAAATWSATSDYRLALMRGVVPDGLTVYGDVGWQRILPDAEYKGEVRYGTDLANVFAGSDICLNATSLQMATAVNQRVFDVPAAGGFVLSDDVADIQVHFDVGSEAIVYTSMEHLIELTRFYKDNEKARLSISKNARRRVASCHTYNHRIAQMISILRKRYK